MPNYIIKCPSCGRTEEVICMVADRNSQLCDCGGTMKVKITQDMGNFRMRHGRPDIIEWKKQRGVLDL